ncbi:MAG: hypothetical protein M1825_005265 [Sarcosagium campestre]|nr:MAG: hypothetical protein M1825_005265 [Sarcosagium campestre]
MTDKPQEPAAGRSALPKAAVAVSAKRKPPPESAESVRTRSLIILSFWVVIIFLGLPTWWRTTSIYRAKLPLRSMMDWADGRACRPVFPLQIHVEAPTLQEIDAQHLVRLTQLALDDLNDFSAHHLRLHLARSAANSSSQPLVDEIHSYDGDAAAFRAGDPDDVALTLCLATGETGSSPSSHLHALAPRLDITYAPNQIPSLSSTSSHLASFIAGKLRDIFAEEQAMIAYILSTTSPAPALAATGNAVQGGSQMPSPATSSSSNGRESRPPLMKALSSELAATLARRSTRAVKYAPTYHLTFSLFTPSATPSSWEIETALRENVQPLLEALAPISNFTIDTQVQLYATFSPSIRAPEYDEQLGAWTLGQDSLSGFINAAEWPLSPSIGGAPTVNFVLYVPSAAQTPLVVKENRGDSWLIPQWGGVVISNPASAAPGLDPIPARSHLDAESLQQPLLTFSHQLLSLLGTPQTPSSLPLRLSTLGRARSASLLLSASSTLGSLARLTLALPSISIPRTVADSVDKTISHLERACADLRDGRFDSALENGRVAEAEAERGFFEKSMVGQVYFPDEHKVAVYLPLLGPIGVPLVMGALKELKRMWIGWKKG